MNKIAVVYWSGTGNTEMMAKAVAEGAAEKGAAVDVLTPSEFGSDKMDQYDAVAFGCPAMGAEVLEEGEFQPMFDDCCAKLNGKKIGLFGSWGWGGGWLDALHFHDFAGSTFVHSVGGWAALSGVILLGPRIGKYVDGKVMPIMGHNMPLVTIGVFLLWLGWFGFNGASALNADPGKVSLVLVNTMIAASAAVVSSMVTSKVMLHHPDLSMTMNGCLAGLVGITAGADCVSVGSAVIIGLIAGIIVVPAVVFFDRLHLDDPVGALSVHLVNGVWGTLAVGIFSVVPEYTFKVQLLGAAVVGAVSFVSSFAIFFALKKITGIRVSEEEELRGLDLCEHGGEAYPGFQFFVNM